jgi:hypothetical protein
MSGRNVSTTSGPDLLARYLSACVAARKNSEIVQPWGVCEESADDLWFRLTEALCGDPLRLARLVSEELTAAERERVSEALAPLLFALPLRSYPAELRALVDGPRLVLKLRHPPGPGGKKEREQGSSEDIGYLPAALGEALSAYLHTALKWAAARSKFIATVSSGGRRRRVCLTQLSSNRGFSIRFLERLPSQIDLRI